MSDSQQRGAAIAAAIPLLRDMSGDEAATFIQSMFTGAAAGTDLRYVLVVSRDITACVSNIPKERAAQILRATADQIDGGTVH